GRPTSPPGWMPPARGRRGQGRRRGNSPAPATRAPPDPCRRRAAAPRASSARRAAPRSLPAERAPASANPLGNDADEITVLLYCPPVDGRARGDSPVRAVGARGQHPGFRAIAVARPSPADRHRGAPPRFELALGDITAEVVDAIVTPANQSLLGNSGGVDAALHPGPGTELLAACLALGGCAIGDAKVTPGFQLSARWIIHAV